VALREASHAGWLGLSVRPEFGAWCMRAVAEAELASGDLGAARQWAEDAVSATTGFEMKFYAAEALLTRARVAIVLGEAGRAEDDAHEALALSAAIDSLLYVPDLLECLAGVAGGAQSHSEAVRLCAAADAVRMQIGHVR